VSPEGTAPLTQDLGTKEIPTRTEGRTIGARIESPRVCPLCDRETALPYCEGDGMATVLVDPPSGVRAQSLEVDVTIGGRYRVEQRLGHGGFATVYGARHLGTGQKVALKILSGGPEDDRTALRRFFREARVTAGLLHPNTVRVFDFGQDDSGVVYLAMELLTGCTLGQEMKKRLAEDRVFSEREAIDIAVEILRSLGEAHALGLVHRDLTPGNVFLLEVAGDDRRSVKVLDFGIVKGGGAPLTRRAVCMGTMSFASPEASRGVELDGRADLYALGVLLYWMLAGETPYGTRSPAELLRAHAFEEFPSLAEKLRVPVSRELLEVITRATAKSRELRYPDAASMREALLAVPIGPRAPKKIPWIATAIVASGAAIGLWCAQLLEAPPPVVAAAAPAPIVIRVPVPAPVVAPEPEPEPAPEIKTPPKRASKPRPSALKRRI
jgi:eukaryotic-like serine/threonine-protein kinase